MHTSRLNSRALRRLAACVAALVAAVVLVNGRMASVGAQSGSVLVQPHHLVYEGAFRLPGQNPYVPQSDANSFNGGGEALAYVPATNTLMAVASRCCDPTVAEIHIPQIRQSATVAGLDTASYRQPFTAVLQGTHRDIGCGGPMGGLLPFADRLIVTMYCFYDAAYSQVKSHWRTSLDFSNLGPVAGPYEMQSPVSGGGRAGFVSGYMTTVPAEWQAALGGNALAGNCCIPIITRTSWGPAASVFNAMDVGVVEPIPATALIAYPSATPLDGCQATSTLFNCATAMGGVIFPAGTSSVLFFGTQGIGAYCYGNSTNDPAQHLQPVPNEPGNMYCYDLGRGDKGNHAYPYVHYVWAYNANDLVAVKNGQKAAWQVRPYATWAFNTPFENDNRSVLGATYDATSRRVFLSIGGQDGAKPLIQVFRLETGATTPSDTTGPSVFLTAPAQNATVTGAVSLTAAATDNVGVAGVWFTVDGNTVGTEDQTAPYQASWSSGSVSNGAHVVRAVARDAAGNTTSSSTVTVNVSNGATDGAAPTVSLTSPSNGTTVNGLVTLSALASDNVGVASVQFWINGALGGTDTTAPYSMGWNTAVAANAPHTVHAVAFDSAGNSASSQTITVTVNNAGGDTTDPTVTVTSPGSGASVSNTVTLAANALDNVGVASVQFTVDGVAVGAADTTAPYSVAWVTTAASNGSHVVLARAIDTAGNDAMSAPVTVTVSNIPQDTTPPTVNVTAPAAGATVAGSVTVTASATASAGVAGVQFTLDGVNVGAEDTTSPYAVAWNTTSTANGTHVLRAVARTSTGTSSSSGSVSVTVNNVSSDRTLPTVSMTAPSQNAVVSTTTTVSASASDNVGVVSVQFTLDGVSIGTPDLVAPYSISWVTTGAVNGFHSLRAIATDAAGNARTSSARSVYVSNTGVDVTAPSVAVTSPGTGATVSGSVNLTASGTDNVGVIGVQFAVDGVAVGSEDTTAPFERSWSTSSLLNKPYQITATARDAAGNRTTSPAVTVGVKNMGKGKAADINDDGKPDLVFSHNTGQLYTWFMNGSSLIGQSTFSPEAVNPVWQVASMDDFNGDGKVDFVWQNSVSGQVYLWFLDKATLVGEVSLVDSGPWRVAATGDLNGDDRADIVWRNPADGQLRVSFMDGTTVLSAVDMTPEAADPTWRIAGASDLNMDGKDDLVWQNSATGALAYWMMDGAAAVSSGALSPGVVNVAWQIRAVADYDLDGYADLIFQHGTSGQLYAWFLNGTTLARHNYLTPSQVDPSWRIVGGK